MKKVFKFVVMAAVVAAMVSSCGNRTNSKATASDEVSDSTEVVVDSVAVDTTQVAE